ITGNTIYGVQSAVLSEGLTAQPSLKVTNNTITRCQIAWHFNAPSAWHGIFEFTGNTVDLDPLFESATRATSSGQPTGGWGTVGSTSPILMFLANIHGILAARNILSNM